MLKKSIKNIKKLIKNKMDIKKTSIFVKKYLKKWQNLDLVL